MPINAGTVQASSTVSLAGFKQGMREMYRTGVKNADKLEKRFMKIGGTLQSVGMGMTAGLTAPLLAASGLAVKMAADYEQSFADIRKTVDATELQFESMGSELRALAKEIPTPIEELNRLAGVSGQLGVGADNIVQFTKTIAMLGDTTDVAGEQAALSLSRFMNVMGTAQTDIDRVGSTIVGLGNNFAAMESEIIDIATSMAAFGNQMDLSESQVLAFSAAIAASGGQTEAASTAFQKTAATMQQAVLEGNKDLQTFARVAGVSADEFSNAFKKNAAGALRLFLGGLKDVSDQGQSTASVLDELGLADQRLQREFGKLIGNLDQLDNALSQADEEWERNTALTEEAQKRYKTFSSQMSTFKNTIKDLGITIGNDLVPIVKGATDMIKGIVNGLNNMSTGARHVTIAIGGFVAAIGPLSLAFGTLLKHLPKLIAGMKALNATMIANPYILVAAAVAAIGAKAYISWQRVKELNEEVSKVLAEDIKTTSLDQINSAMDSIKERISEINKTVASSRMGMATPKQQKELSELNAKLVELEHKRKGVRLELLRKDIANMEPNVKRTTDAVKEMSNAYKNFSVGINIPTDDIIQPEDLEFPEIELGGMIAAEGSLMAINEQMQRLITLQAHLPIGSDAWKEYNAQIEALKEKYPDLIKTADAGGQAMMGLANSIGQVFSQAVLHAQNLEDVVKNLLKQLASKAFVVGLGALLTGGASLGGGSFLSALFGGMFHTGGMVPGVGERMIRAKGGEMVLTPSQQRALGGMQKPSMSISGDAIGKAVGRELDKRIRSVSDRKIFEMAEHGRYS